MSTPPHAPSQPPSRRVQARWLDESPAESMSPAPAHSTTPAWVVLVSVIGVATYVGFLFYGVAYHSGYVLGALPVVPVLVLITALFAKRLARLDDDPSVYPLLMGALAVKLLGALIRYWIAYTVYKGQVDATDYDKVGRFLASSFRHGNFAVHLSGRFSGTNFMRVATGAVYTVMPASRMAGFLVFAWLGFIGLVLYWRAFRMAVPIGDARRYALLLFLLPSLVYWPSAIGKEAWMTLVLGVCALGVARIFTNHLVTGVLLLGVGLLGSAYVRPHLGLAVFAGLLVAVLLRRRKSRNPVVPIVAIGLLLYVGLALVSQNQQYFGVENLTQESIQNQLDHTAQQTNEGGSAFTPVRVNTPADFPLAFVTIFYRPTPLEAHNAQGMLTAAEGMTLVALTVLSIRRV
ncbi:MAG: hypothetical protein QOI55_2102, partial [Actinomycetota bacterium]|nr:hypothetical protein [Actinomycetota bacterium]